MPYYLRKRFVPPRWFSFERMKRKPRFIVHGSISNLSDIRKPMNADILNNEHFTYSNMELLDYFMHQQTAYTQLPYHTYIEFTFEYLSVHVGSPKILESQYLANLAIRSLIPQHFVDGGLFVAYKHNFARSTADRDFYKMLGFQIAALASEHKISGNHVYHIDELFESDVDLKKQISNSAKDGFPEYNHEFQKYLDSDSLRRFIRDYESSGR